MKSPELTRPANEHFSMQTVSEVSQIHLPLPKEGDIFARDTMRGIYPRYFYDQIRRAASPLSPGECVAYKREISIRSSRKKDQHAPVTDTYSFSYYPAGVPKEVAETILDYYRHDLSHQDQIDRFGGPFVDSNGGIYQALINPNTRLLVAQALPENQDQEGKTDILGTVVVLPDPEAPYPEISDDIATHAQLRGIGITQMVDMLGICNEDTLSLKLFTSSHKSRKSLIRLRDMPVPWQFKILGTEEGEMQAELRRIH